MIASCYYDKGDELFPQLDAVCDTTNVTFTKNISPLLSSYCWSCHSNANAASFGNNLRLENYAEVVSNVSRIYDAVSHQPGVSAMPKNSGSLSTCAISQIRIWKNNGTPQ